MYISGWVDSPVPTTSTQAMQGTASATCQGDDRVIVDYQLHLSSQKWWSEAEACATSIRTSYCTADTFSQSTHAVQTGV